MMMMMLVLKLHYMFVHIFKIIIIECVSFKKEKQNYLNFGILFGDFHNYPLGYESIRHHIIFSSTRLKIHIFHLHIPIMSSTI